MTRLLTMGECADQVKVDRVTIYRLAGSGTVERADTGHVYADAWVAYLNRHREGKPQDRLPSAFMTPRECAALAGVRNATITGMVHAGLLDATVIGQASVRVRAESRAPVRDGTVTGIPAEAYAFVIRLWARRQGYDVPHAGAVPEWVTEGVGHEPADAAGQAERRDRQAADMIKPAGQT